MSCSTGFLLYDNTCVASCPDGLFANLITGKCQKCSPNCISCAINGTCTTCETGYNLVSPNATAATGKWAIFNNTCV
jgi:proprotein convertase subtilisin/kexin type 5